MRRHSAPWLRRRRAACTPLSHVLGRALTLAPVPTQVTKEMGGVVKGMDKVLASMDVGKITQVAEHRAMGGAP